MPEVLRTPDDRFADIPDYPFEPNWHPYDGMRMHYLDVGSGRPVVLFHGEPTWSFLYRKVIPPLVEAGYRVIAPDYLGFGKSDKPVDPDFYTYDRHVASVASLLAAAGITSATAVVQDWGGPIGLRMAVEHPEWFNRLTIMNTGLFTGSGRASEGFLRWRAFVERNPDLPVGMVMANSMIGQWDAGVLAAYEAPFPDQSYKVGAHRFPLIVPLEEADPGAAEMAATLAALESWTDATQVLFSTEDPIFSTRVGERWASRVPGATGLELVEKAGHFLQEDQGEEVGTKIAAFLARTD